jgi:6-phosphogluconate dehydrogenase
MSGPVADLGLIGLAVMGQNLIMNMADHGFTICAFNRTVSKVDAFLANEAKGKSIVGAKTVEEFVSKLKSPRRVMLLVQAGKAVDDWIEKLLPLLSEGDIIIDGGNSHFPDSNRRTQYLNSKGLSFVGSGVSGGEEGARYGPSLMPGGNEAAWPHIKDIFQSIAAKSDGEACCEWVGDEGAGHYVKMVHNGIEYGDMQLICEAYDIMKRGLGLSSKEIGDVFAKWNKGVLDSFLIEITRDIMYYNDDDGTALVEKILDKAGQKGTGKWTAVNALDLGMPVTLIAESVLARCLSSIKDERSVASTKLEFISRTTKFEGDKEQFLEDLEQALYASKIISYAQGFMLMQEAAKEFGWKLNKPSIALMWRGGCIIRSVFLKDITNAYRQQPDLQNLLFDDFFNKAIHKAQPGWRDVVAKAAILGIPTPAFSTALSWFDGYRTKELPANLLQAQRDYFGAHTFRIKPEAAKEFGWKLNKPSIALMWRGGCIIRSVFLKDITSAYRNQPDLANLLFDDFFNKAIHKAQPGWRDVVAKAALLGIPTPAFSTALSWFDGYRTKDLPANLLQAQRDYFGAHTFHIKPEHASEKYPEGKDIHVNWTGRGGNVSASTYQA